MIIIKIHCSIMNELLGNALKRGVNDWSHHPFKRREIGETFSGMN